MGRVAAGEGEEDVVHAPVPELEVGHVVAVLGEQPPSVVGGSTAIADGVAESLGPVELDHAGESDRMPPQRGHAAIAGRHGEHAAAVPARSSAGVPWAMMRPWSMMPTRSASSVSSM